MTSKSGIVEVPGSVLESREITPCYKDRQRYGIKEYLIDYTVNSNLHGLKYIGEKEQSFPERFFWLLMFTFCVVFSSVLIRRAWIEWNDSPKIVNLEEYSTPLWQIPYPAVTVCFETKSLPAKFNYTKYYHLYKNNNTYMQLTEEERNLFEDITLVCHERLAPVNGRKFSDGIAIVENLKRVSPNMSEVFLGCKWKDIPKHTCTDTFFPIVTEDGLCYTFNIMVAEEVFRIDKLYESEYIISILTYFENNGFRLHKEFKYIENIRIHQSWSLEEGYSALAPLETYPRRALGYGVKAGLTFILRSKDIDLDYICKGPVQGFKMLLHNPAEFPRMSQLYIRLPLAQEVVVAVKPKMIKTSEEIKSFHPTVRQCYFPSERYLRYFKVYTQANCEIECLTNFTYARCGCVHFGMPHGPCMTVCNAGSVACIRKAQIDLVMAEIEAKSEKGVDQDNTSEEEREVVSRCRCLPSCTSIEYEVEVSQADYNWRNLFTAYDIREEENMKDQKFTRVIIFLKEAQFTTSTRFKLRSITDFLASCGGLLGFFLGFSILSIAEILYFLTLRILCIVRRKHRSKKRKNGVLSADLISSPMPNNLKD